MLESYANSNDDNNTWLSGPGDLTPIIILKAKSIQNTLMHRDLTALIDSGSTGTMIKRSALPYGTRTSRGQTKQTTTTNGILESSDAATIQSIKCPEFNRIIPDITGDIFNSPTCRYDVILGRKDIAKLGIKLNFANQTVEWLDHSIPMRSTTRSIPEPLQEAIDSELFAAEPIKILERNYQSVTASDVTNW